MKSIHEFLEENILLTETSRLGRFYDLMKNDERPFAIITAHRTEKDIKKGNEENEVIAKETRAAGFGYKWVDGAYVENRGTPEEVTSKKVSLFIVGDLTKKLWKLCLNWAKEYGQDGFVYKGPGVGVQPKSYKSDGSVDLPFTKLHMDRISIYHTKVRGGSHDGRPWFYEVPEDE